MNDKDKETLENLFYFKREASAYSAWFTFEGRLIATYKGKSAWNGASEKKARANAMAALRYGNLFKGSNIAGVKKAFGIEQEGSHSSGWDKLAQYLLDNDIIKLHTKQL